MSIKNTCFVVLSSFSKFSLFEPGVKRIAFLLLSCSVFAVSAEDSTLSKWVWTHYQKNITYKHFEDICDEDWADIPRFASPTNLYADLLKFDKTPDRRVGNLPLIKEYAEAELKRSKNMTLSQATKTLSPKEIVFTSVTLASKLLTPELVDGADSDFSKEMGENLPLDRYVYCGRGDCDKFASTALEIFKILKAGRKDMRHIFLAGQLADQLQPHAWNSLIIFTNSDVIVSHLDPTFSSTGNTDEMFGKADFHYFDHATLHAGAFYQDISGNKYAKTILLPLLDDTNLSAVHLSNSFQKLFSVASSQKNEALLNELKDSYASKKSQLGLAEYRVVQAKYYFNAIYLARDKQEKKKVTALCTEAKSLLDASIFERVFSYYCKN